MADALHVEHVDFVSFLTQDIPRAKKFYAETLGLEIETEGPDDMEFRAGQVTLDIFNPASQGQPFAPSVTVPARWHGRIYERPGGLAILHAANFRLPANDDGFGTKATMTMGSRGIFIVLLESRTGTGFKRTSGYPSRSDAPTFSPDSKAYQLLTRSPSDISQHAIAASRSGCSSVGGSRATPC